MSKKKKNTEENQLEEATVVSDDNPEEIVSEVVSDNNSEEITVVSDNNPEEIVAEVVSEKKNEVPDFLQDISEKIELPTSPKMEEVPVDVKQEPKIILVLSPGRRSVVGKLEENFQPSAEGWWTSENDTKSRYNAGIYSNNFIGTFGTFRVIENGQVEFVKHIDFEKRVARTGKEFEKFKAKKMSEKNGLIQVAEILIQFHDDIVF